MRLPASVNGYQPKIFLANKRAAGPLALVKRASFGFTCIVCRWLGTRRVYGFERLALAERVTHSPTHGFPDASFDFIFAKGLRLYSPASDHCIESLARDARFSFAFSFLALSFRCRVLYTESDRVC